MYKTWNESDIRKVLNDIGSKMGMSCENVSVIISGRMTKCKGMFTFNWKKINGVNTIVPENFKFAKILLDGRYSEKAVYETIVHEYIHCYVNVKYNKHHGHNAFFKRACRKAGISDETYFTEEPLVNVSYKILEIERCCDKLINSKNRGIECKEL